jgi:hypothetical protein
MSQIALTNSERNEAIVRFGYTPREAAFLSLAALHGGFFLRRQYCRFIDREVGGTAAALLEKVITNGHATAVAGCQNAKVYHLSARPFFAALGQEDNRNRRQRPPVVIKNRLMGLDFVLDHPNHHYLATEQEKVTYFTTTLGIDLADLPVKIYRSPTASVSTARYFMDKYPLFVREAAVGTPMVSFCFVDEGLQTGSRFESFLKEHARLFVCLSRFDVIYVTTPATPFQSAESVFQQMVLDGFFRTGGISSEDSDRIDTHFRDRHLYESGQHASFDRTKLLRLRADRQRFGGAFFDRLFERWKSSGADTIRKEIGLQSPTEAAPQAHFLSCVLHYNYDVFGTTSTLKTR